MAYFKINDIDYSHVTSGLKVKTNVNYSAQLNASGDSVVDVISKKRTIEVTIIPLNDSDMIQLQAAIDRFRVSISFRNPKTSVLEQNIDCIIPDNEVEYYTLSGKGRTYKAITLTFIEL